MSIGRKIKELRTAKCITQSQLAGEFITRNMLSRIENGAAMPSLSTIIFIAEKLNVPVGYLLEDGENQRVYKKINSIDNIKRALCDGDYRICRDLCRTVGFEDDELCFIIAKCDICIAKEELIAGKLRSAIIFLEEALEYDEKSIYSNGMIAAESEIYFKYIKKFSSTLAIDIAEIKSSVCVVGINEFCNYILAVCDVEKYNAIDIDTISYKYRLDRKGSYFAHINAKYYMSIGDYKTASELLKGILNSQDSVPEPMMFDVFFDLEMCAKFLEDYKRAYEYSANKVNLLERMLSETDI